MAVTKTFVLFIPRQCFLGETDGFVENIHYHIHPIQHDKNPEMASRHCQRPSLAP
jgi:hypothetical protein